MPFRGSFLLAALLMAPAIVGAEPEKRGPRVRLGGVMVGAGYAHSSGYPYYWSPGAWYSPLYYSPWWWGGGFFHPGYFNDFRQGPGMGEVKLRGDLTGADVYLDGAYAGPAEERKSIWLEAGAYNLELRAAGNTFKQRIYVLTGKRLDIRPASGAKTESK